MASGGRLEFAPAHPRAAPVGRALPLFCGRRLFTLLARFSSPLASLACVPPLGGGLPVQPEAPSALAWTGLVGDACWVLNALVHRHQPAGVRSLAERGSSSPYSLVFSLACVPPLGAACRSSSSLSLPSSSAVGSAAAVAASSMCTELGRLWRTVWHVARWRGARHLTLRHLTLPCRGQWFASGLLGPGRKLSRVTFSLLACLSDSLGSAPCAGCGCWMCVSQARARNLFGAGPVRARLAAVSSTN